MNRTKLLLVSSCKEIRVCMSTRKKPQNHYETLNLSQDCTQEDIKSAYYDLSKKYHPDKNTSAEAKNKFQNVSNAYEVLGNFHNRKLYDRNLMARGGRPARTTSYTAPEDPLAGFHRSRAANVNPTKSSDNYQNYDFNAWTRAHYGQTFKKQLDRKRKIVEREAFRERMQREAEEEWRSSSRFLLIATSLFLITAIIQTYVIGDFDKNIINEKKKSKNS